MGTCARDEQVVGHNISLYFIFVYINYSYLCDGVKQGSREAYNAVHDDFLKAKTKKNIMLIISIIILIFSFHVLNRATIIESSCTILIHSVGIFSLQGYLNVRSLAKVKETNK